MLRVDWVDDDGEDLAAVSLSVATLFLGDDQIGYARIERRSVTSKRTGRELGPALEVAWLEVSNPVGVRTLMCEVLSVAKTLIDSGDVGLVYFDLINDRLREFVTANARVFRVDHVPFVYVMTPDVVAGALARLCGASQ